MTDSCNGCERDIEHLSGVLSFGNLWQDDTSGPQDIVGADYHKTLCPRCQHVLKDVLMSSDLSIQWDNYEWELMDDNRYTENYE